MPLPNETQVKAVLQPFEDALVNIVLKAWEDSADDRSRYQYKRTLRCIMHERIMRVASAAFDGAPGVHIHEKHETAYFIFDGVIARIKHGDERGMGRNNHTQSSFAFINPEAEPWELPLGLPHEQRVDVAYLLNGLETRVEQILVTGRDGETPLWSYPLYPRAAKPIAVLPVAPKDSGPPMGPGDVLSVPGGAEEEDDKKTG